MALNLLEQAKTWIADCDSKSTYLYAIVDSAQDKQLWQQLTSTNPSATILASGAEDLTPHLVFLGFAANLDTDIVSLLSRPRPSASFSLLNSSLRLDELQAHLRQFAKVKLLGNYEMILAFWDPAILGTLVGQSDDETLHVKGPVLDADQALAFLSPISAWWYKDRENVSHRIESPPENVATDAPNGPLTLNQGQEDALVEASVPDQVLYHLESNRPTLFDEKLPHSKRYRFIRAVLPSARKLGLEGMRDLANFVALCLVYRQRIETDQQILKLLDQVQKRQLTFDKALTQMPE